MMDMRLRWAMSDDGDEGSASEFDGNNPGAEESIGNDDESNSYSEYADQKSCPRLKT